MKASQTQKQNITKPVSSLLGWWKLVTKRWQMDLNPNNLSSVLKYLAQIRIMGTSIFLSHSSL